MAETMTAKQAAAKWNISTRRVNEYIRGGKIEGVHKKGNAWVMPADTEKPADERLKSGKYVGAKERRRERLAQREQYAGFDTALLPDSLSDAFKALLVNPELVIQFFDMYPFPVEIFTPDGLSVYLNRAWMELFGITDASLIVGRFNVRNDPASERLTSREFIDKMLLGEAFRLSDISAPVDDHVERGVAEEKAYDAAFIDVHSIPVWDGDNFKYAICMLIVRQTYKGKTEVARAMDYITEHWVDEFDLDKIARAATLSRRHLQRMFKDVTKLTPFDFYKNKKIDELQEKLLDPDLNVTEAFAACGVEPTGRWYNIFKEETGLTPLQFQKKNDM